MATKDYIVIFISGSSLILSLTSLIVTLVQKNKEITRNIRKTLSDILESISKVNVESSKLKSSKEINHNSEDIIELRRNYNSQRRVLVAHADFLILKYDKIATEIDCNIIAGAYSTIGDQEKAEYFWHKTINKSISLPIRHMNLRGFGSFLFNNDKVDLARKYFSDALSMDMLNNDSDKLMKIDTYLMLSSLEMGKGNKEVHDFNLLKATDVLSTIGNDRRKNEMNDRIKRQ